MPHYETSQCVEKASSLLANDDLDSLRYASLQLRMGIEYLFYELIPLYKDELPDDITTANWQPQKIFDEILECNPGAGHDGRYAFGPSGTRPEDGGWVGYESKAPNKKLLKDHYHRLGKYLHAPVDMKNPSSEKWKTDLEKAIDCLRQYKLGQVLSNIRPLVEITCRCGRTIKRNKYGVEASGVMRCPDPGCKIIYDVKFVEDRMDFYVRESSYYCPYCEQRNFFPTCRAVKGSKLECGNCKKGVELQESLRPIPIDGDPESFESSEDTREGQARNTQSEDV